MATTILLRRGAAIQWSNANTVLGAGEAGVETDTGRLKIGDGATAWNSLPYFPRGIEASQVGPGSITEAKIASGAVTETKLAPNSVTSAKIVDGTIVNSDIDASAAIARTKIEGTPPPQARTISAGTGLTGGGDLSANRTLSVNFGSVAGTVTQGNDTRLSDMRVPTDGSVTNAKVATNAAIARTKIEGTPPPSSRTITAGAGLSGLGDLSADRTVSIATSGVTDSMLAGNIAPSKITGTALVASLVDAKGDLLVGTADDIVARLAVPADGRTLIADPTTVSGWGSVAVGNQLSSNQATGGDTLNSTAGFVVQTGGVSIARNTTDPASGTGCIRTTITSGTFGFITVTSTSGIPVDTEPVTFHLKMRGTVGKTGELRLQWRNSSGGTVGTVVVLGTVTLSDAWQLIKRTAYPPAGATHANWYFGIFSGTTGDTFDVDELGWWYGAGGVFRFPGVPIPQLGFYWDESVGRRKFDWDDVNNRWQMTYADTGWRDVRALATTVPAEGTLAVLQVRRVDNLVRWRIAYGSTAGVVRVDQIIPAGGIPAGFGVDVSHENDAFGVMDRSGFDTPKRFSITSSGAFNVRNDNTVASNARGAMTYLTAASWPTSLPGTAVGSIPL